MNILKIFKKGAAAAVSSYRLILMIWIVTLVMVLLVTIPLRSYFVSIFGNSMIVDKFKDGFDLGLISDMGNSFMYLVKATSSGSFFLILAGFLLMTFFSGGLFACYATAWGKMRLYAFFRESAQQFWAFLKTAIIMILIIFIFTMIILGIPISINMAHAHGSLAGVMGMVWFYLLWALGMPVWIFVADASRRWITATGSKKAFRAIGAGFRELKKKFWLSYGTVLIIMILNVAFIAIVSWLTFIAKPDTGIQIFLFFILTQLFFYIRLMMKAWRYASVCELAKIR